MDRGGCNEFDGKRSRLPLCKSSLEFKAWSRVWNSKRGPEFTWEHEDQMRIKYPQLFVDRVVEPARGLLAGIHGLFSGRYCCLVRRVTYGYPWPELEGKGFGLIRERLRSSAWCLND
ncbi:hypothetical protein Tco_0168556 [Tanacetum coccineum]